ncbi:elongation factor Ts [Sandaracinobacter neustonicus]|uniref:Elongation factor Ts n=1 Tax=Sandaracinobacter neustonicus TaxID=1715348 RepID=A0A501XDP5_9SPHN|nr:translation elongation factor Ts [Sandaracinobacter neustonicus]TPE58616.1 elongation factor Ts [Sandaracinobacter neustonicus]
MANITATLVKELRDLTGAGMMDAKKALVEVEGEIEKAIDWLRAKGLASAAKKSGRTAAEGLVGVAVSGNRGAVVEVNAETDFVAKNAQFQGFVKEVAGVALAKGEKVEDLLAADYPAGGGSVQDVLTHNIATIGEQQVLRRAEVLEATGVVASYIHNAAAPGLGKIGVLVAIDSDIADKDALMAIGKQVAMHVAAANPLALSIEHIDPSLLERERAIATEKAAGSGKPADIIERMVDGAVKKFAGEQALLSQVFVIDGKSKVGDFIATEAKRLSGNLLVAKFIRFQLGEGIEKAESDFAAEVAAAAGVA